MPKWLWGESNSRLRPYESRTPPLSYRALPRPEMDDF